MKPYKSALHLKVAIWQWDRLCVDRRRETVARLLAAVQTQSFSALFLGMEIKSERANWSLGAFIIQWDARWFARQNIATAVSGMSGVKVINDVTQRPCRLTTQWTANNCTLFVILFIKTRNERRVKRRLFYIT